MKDSLNYTIQSFVKELSEIAEKISHKRETSRGDVDAISKAIERSCQVCLNVENEVGREAEEVQNWKVRLRDEIKPWFSQSWFMDRATRKERGYPGDFEILEGIYDREVKSKDMGEALDAYFLQTVLAQAVRNRKDYCRNFLEGFIAERADREEVDVLDIACGPCRELRESKKLANQGNIQWHLLDHDEGALQYARSKMVEAGYAADSIHCICKSVLRLFSVERNLRDFKRFDCIYSVGLFDYLPDNALQKIFAGTFPLLKEDGVYLVAFKDCRKYDKTEYQWIADWNFLQRTEEECRHLVESSGAEIVETMREPTEAIFFYVLRPR